jgi:type I restriction enzyme S subunit
MVAVASTSWKSHCLASVVDQAQTGFASGEDLEDGLLQIRMNNITTDGAIDWTKKRRVPPPNNKKGAPFAKAGNVLFNHTNSPELVGKSAFFSGYSEPVTYSNHFICLAPKENVLDGSYLARWLQQQWQSGCFRSMCKQWVNQATVGKDSLLNLEIPLPPLEEQKRIAAILDQADDIRRKRQHAIDRLNQLGQAIFHEMFGDLLLSNDGTAKLGDVCDVRDGTHDSPKYVDEGHPLLTSKNFSAGSIDYKGSNLISDKDYALINKRSKVDKGDIVMPMIGTIGSPVIVDFDPDFAIKNVALIKFKNDLMNREFVRQVLDGSLFKSHVASKGRGGTQKFISLGDIRDFKIPLPSMDRQNAFAEVMRRLRAEVFRNMDVKHRTDSLFASLQHRAFAGDL